MPDAPPAPQDIVTELQVSAHLMQLDAGVYCVYHSPGSSPPDPQTGLPGARLSVPPGPSGRGVTISGFRDDGWLGALDAAALIRVAQGPAQVLMTIYQAKHSQHEPPRLQVTRLVEGVQAASAHAVPNAAPSAPGEGLELASGQTLSEEAVSDAEIAAHLQNRGDVLARLGEWVGERGSQRWVEGFALSPREGGVTPGEVEYQAVLGRGWLSPWAEGGQYCGSRGMALPILGLRVRLRGVAAETHAVELSATFTDGTAIGPVGQGEACEAASLAPLEAFRIAIAPQRKAQPPAAPASKRAAVPVAAPVAKAPAAKPTSEKVPAAKAPAVKAPAVKAPAVKAQAKKAPVKPTPAKAPAKPASAARKPVAAPARRPPGRGGKPKGRGR